MQITVATTVAAPLGAVWDAWTTPADIMQWNAASDDWHTPAASVDLRVGGTFSSRMEARDGSTGFDFAGTYSEVVPRRRIVGHLTDGRAVVVEFDDGADGVAVRVTFDADATYPIDLQRQGWQAILDRFSRHVESRA